MVDAFRSSILIPIFRGENYDFWSIKMKTYFCAQDLWDIVSKGFTIPEDISILFVPQKKELKENKQKDSLVLLALQLSLGDKLFPRIIGAQSAKAAWDKLQEEFQGSDKIHTCKL